jgi:hypothetical protein
MVDSLGIVAASYTCVALFFLISRCLKILDLHQEFQIVRAREQKSHIKSHAQILASGFKLDIVWPVTLYKSLKSSLIWLREK